MNKNINPRRKKASVNRSLKHERGVLVETAEQIEKRTRKVKDKGTEIFGKTSDLAEEVIKKVRKGVTDMGEIASKALDELNQIAQGYAERYKNIVEMKNLTKQKQMLVTKLGLAVYKKMKNKENSNIYIDEEIKKIILKLEKNDKQIIKLGKKLENK
jgi:uncharacterized protein YoxC